MYVRTYTTYANSRTLQRSVHGAIFIGNCWNMSQIILRLRRCATKQCISNQPHFFLLPTTLRAKRCVLKQSKKTHRIWTLSLIIIRLKKCATRQWVKTLTLCNSSLLVLWRQSKQKYGMRTLIQMMIMSLLCGEMDIKKRKIWGKGYRKVVQKIVIVYSYDATRILIALAWRNLFFSIFLLIQHKAFCAIHHWIWFNARINFMLLILYLVMNWQSYLKLKFIIFRNLHQNIILYQLNFVNTLTLK